MGVSGRSNHVALYRLSDFGAGAGVQAAVAIVQQVPRTSFYS